RRAIDRQIRMEATMAYGTRCRRMPCRVRETRPDPRFASVGILAIKPFHYSQDVIADFEYLGRWCAYQHLASALCRVKCFNGHGTGRFRIEWPREALRDCNNRTDGDQERSSNHPDYSIRNL